MGFFSIFNQIGRDISNVEHTVTSGLATAYKESKVLGTDLIKASEGAGYEVGHFIKTGRLIPFGSAVRRAENTSTKGFLFNIPYNLGVKTGRALARGSGSVIANTIPFTGTFGHLFAHPHENIYNKASDIAFGVLDIAGIGDIAQALKKPVQEGVDIIGNTLAKRITIMPHLEPPRRLILPLPRDFPIHIEPPKLPIIRTPLPILHLPHIDIFPGDLDRLAKVLTNDAKATVRGVQDLGNAVKRVIIEDLATHYLDINPYLGKIDHYIVGDTGIIKAGEYSEDNIAKILGKNTGGAFGGLRNFFGKLDRILRSKPLTYGLLGIGIGAPIAGGLLAGGSTQQQTSPSSPYPSSPSPTAGSYTSQQTYPQGSATGGAKQMYAYPPVGGASYSSPYSSQSADILNPASPQAQYYSALASQTTQTQSTPSSPSPSSPTSTTSTSSSKGSLFSNPFMWIAIAVVFILIIILVVR